MEAGTTSPRQRGYHAEDLESQGGENGTSDDVEDSEDDSESTPKVTRDGSTSQLHPDDSMHKYWYETTVRLRCIFFVFFSLAIVLAVALGSTTECFFALLATPPSQGLSAGVVFACVFVPAFLLVSAIYVDECIDMGLDAADRPSFGLFRATVTVGLKAISDRVQTDHIERTLVVALESLPIIFAIVTVVFADIKAYWYKDFARGYCLGGLVFAMLVCITYILCHIYVGHNPERDEMMAITYHNMGPLGRFKRVNKRPEKPLVDARPHWGRSVLYFLIGLFLEVLVVVLFIILHDFFTVFIGQLLATIFWALSVRQYAPRLLGKAFWSTFVFFILLTVGLLMGTLASASVGRRAGKLLEPLVLGPMAPGYGATGGSFNDLPQNFTVSAGSPHLGYPICSTVWRYPGTPTDPPQEHGLDILDLSVLAYASSFFDEADVRRGLGEMLNGTHLGDWELLEVESPRTVGRWVVVSFPALKLRVISVRGTSNVQDAYADLKVYSGVAVLQMTSVFTPVLALMPTGVTQTMMSGRLSRAIFRHHDLTLALNNAVKRHEAESSAAGQKLLLTGHSLGGALVGAASAAHGVDGIGFSPPGLYYQVQKFDLTLADLQSTFAIVQPANDVVPRVDKQRGMIQWIQCLESAAQCHRLTHTACELWARCGDSSKRDWRKTCSRWYSGGPDGDINQEL